LSFTLREEGNLRFDPGLLLKSHLKDKFGPNYQSGLEQIPRDKVDYDRHDQSHLERRGRYWVCFAANFDICDGINVTRVVHL